MSSTPNTEPHGYKIQGIYYLNKRTHRIQQNVGGACPLLALCNTLFLNHQIHYNKGGRRIKFEELTDCLTQHLQNMLDVDSNDVHKVKTELVVDNDRLLSSDSMDDSKEISDDNEVDDNVDKFALISECVSLFPKLEEGLDINIKFSDCCDFEENPGHRMFSHYGLKLFHGWVVDPSQSRLHSLISDKSYDETIDFLISDPSSSATEEEKVSLEDDKDVIRKFFADSATQLTSYGLERLYFLMDVEDILAIFFRNNHFSTIVKHSGIMYEFVTDEGIVDADPQITWQTLLQISGDEQFVNNKFQSIDNNIHQYTQIAQYNRIRERQQSSDHHDIDDKLIHIINCALDYIDTFSFKRLERRTDTLDRFMCNDYLYGIPLYNDNLSFIVRCFRMNDAQNILNVMNTAHCTEYLHYNNIDFMHNDSQFALIMSSKNNEMCGCCKYEWLKFNFWDWRESDWDDSFHMNTHSFIHILDLAITKDYAHRGLGAQLLRSLMFAFPSRSKFGAIIPAINTAAVKCFTKSHFTIARVQNEYYKMTATSYFSINEYREWINNSIIINQVKYEEDFILNTLFELNLTKYNLIFTEFNINKDALLHLDVAVVQFMIDDENDRNTFINWLNKYKQNNNNITQDDDDLR